MDMEMSMDIIEMARDLGRALQADEKYQRYVNATLENDKDQVLQDLIGKFNTLRVDINREISKSEKDQEKIARLDSEFKTTYRLIMERPGMMEYNAAKSDLNGLVQFINQIIAGSANGQDPDNIQQSTGCTGSCSSCSGCGN